MPVFPVQTTDALLPLVIPVGAGLLLGWFFLWQCRREDRKGWIYARAPRLPIRTLSDHDDAWIRGTVRADRPLCCPWFEEDCVYYSYEKERKVTRTVRDSKGNTRTESHWETEVSESHSIPFSLRDEDGEIAILDGEMEVHDCHSLGPDHEGWSLRHSAHLIPVGASMSALGVKLEAGAFGPLQEVPLLLTGKKPEAFIEGSGRAERWYRWLGFFFIFLGGGAGLFAFYLASGLPANWVWISLAGLLPLIPVWFVSTYNRIIRQKHQVDAAWGQVEVDMGVRGILIPRIVEVVKGYVRHEKEVFGLVAFLRTGGSREERIRDEGRVEGVAGRLLLLHEDYPELLGNELFANLHEKLWVTEEKLASSRDFYSRRVREWNDLVGSFPTSLLAKLFGFARQAYFSTGWKSSGRP